MKGVGKRTLILLAALFVLMQFYQPSPNKTAIPSGKVDFIETSSPPEDVAKIFRRACYDCHSNNTDYRWYDYIQPSRMLVESHIRSAKEELNFNEWGNYSERKRERLLMTIRSQIVEGKMPLPSYTWIHQEARLNKGEVDKLQDWLKKVDLIK